MRIVLDTNCLLMSISKRSGCFWLWQAFRDRKLTLCYTTEILNEYFEILSRCFSVSVANNIIAEILHSPNTEPTTLYYYWNLITADPDDNKFVDCAICANARFIVSNDKHFNVLEEIDFPKIEILTIENFKKILL